MSRLQSARVPALALLSWLAPLSLASAETLLRIDHYDLDELRVTGFELPRKAKLHVEAVGARPRWADDYSAYAWILSSQTREVVWSQEHAHSERMDDSSVLRRSNEDLDLEPGRYELYVWAGSVWSFHGMHINFADMDDWGDVVRGKWDTDRNDRALRRAARDCFVELRSDDLKKGDIKDFEPTGEIPGSAYRATRLGDHQLVQVGLAIDRPMNLRIYALCEYPRGFDAAADGGWIVDAGSRERVWDIRRRDTRPAGGSEKNRLHDDEVHLEAGRYVLYYGTDGSHSWEEWNANPPDDPLNWGITLLAGKGFDAAGFHVDEKYSRGEPLLALTRARDHDWLERSFRLGREAELQVYALGEWDEGNDEFADRAWITAAKNGDTVWEMTDRNTEYAGGADKNRMFDGTVKLPAGEYVAHYETDDSHSYHDWNADSPYEPEAWGITLYPGQGLLSGVFTLIDTPARTKPAHVLVQLVGVGDDARERDDFTLDKPTRVRIYAIGEGVDGEMYDYGWIENKRTDQVVWEMTYRSTRPAGGASKNRMFDGEVLLDAGTYTVQYETDSSHSYPHWNAARPRDARNWGITVSLPGKE